MGGVSDSVDSECFSQMVGNGMLYNLVAHQIRDVFDGTSNTLHVGELTGGETGSEKGWEWVSGVFFSTAFGINGPGTIPGEGVYIRQGGRDSFSSYHPPAGCFFLFVDGSTQLISENTDATVLAALTTRGGGEVFSTNEL